MLSISTFSQSEKQLHDIKPKWKLGDKRMVHTSSTSTVFIKDSLLNNTEVTGNYSIRVIDTVRNFTLSYSHEPGSADIETKTSIKEADSILNFFTGIIKNIEKETKSFKYELLVDKNTGLAFKIKNDSQYLKMIEQLATTIIDDLGRKKAKAINQIDSMKSKVIAYFKSAEPKILETTINEFNYLMQAYSYTFPLNSTISKKTMVHDVNALGEFGGIDVPAILTITSKQKNNSLSIQTDTDYDKDFLLVEIKKKYKKLSDITTSDIFLSEKEETIFKTTNNWILSHRSNVVFKLKEVKIINETMVSFQ